MYLFYKIKISSDYHENMRNVGIHRYLLYINLHIKDHRFSFAQASILHLTRSYFNDVGDSELYATTAYVINIHDKFLGISRLIYFYRHNNT